MGRRLPPFCVVLVERVGRKRAVPFRGVLARDGARPGAPGRNGRRHDGCSTERTRARGGSIPNKATRRLAAKNARHFPPQTAYGWLKVSAKHSVVCRFGVGCVAADKGNAKLADGGRMKCPEKSLAGLRRLLCFHFFVSQFSYDVSCQRTPKDRSQTSGWNPGAMTQRQK